MGIRGGFTRPPALETLVMTVADPTTKSIDVVGLRVELALRQMNQADLAQALRVAPTTLSSWLAGRHPAPSDLAFQIEAALGLPAGALDTCLPQRNSKQPKQKMKRRLK